MATGQEYVQLHKDPAPAYPAQPTGTSSSTPYYGTTAEPAKPPTAGPPQSFVGHIILACFTFWCCGWVFGLVAFILAIVAQDKAHSDAVGARSLGRSSVILSVVGIVVGIVVIIIVAVVYGVAAKNACHHYYVNEKCFRYRSYSANSALCDSQHPDGSYYAGYCYYN